LSRNPLISSCDKVLADLPRGAKRLRLRVSAHILDKVYELGRKCSDTFREIKDQFIRHDPILGDWNYVVDANGFSS
jgi:hypothetical protein